MALAVSRRCAAAVALPVLHRGLHRGDAPAVALLRRGLRGDATAVAVALRN